MLNFFGKKKGLPRWLSTILEWSFFLEICESLRQVFSGLQVFMSDENVSNNSINDQQYGICNSYLLNVKSFDFFPMGFW